MGTPEQETTSDPEESPGSESPDDAGVEAVAASSLPPRVEPGAAPRLERAAAVQEQLVPLEALEDDDAFQLRPPGDVGRLAMDLARLGQAFPVEVRRREGADRFQLIAGFRRVAALRFLQRTAVRARVHDRLSDEDALLIALAGVLHGSAPTEEELVGIEERLARESRLSAAARDMLDRARGTDDELAPESVEEPGEEEVDADELAAELTARLGEVNQDLALLAPVFDALEPGQRAELLQQLRYVAELVAYFEEES